MLCCWSSRETCRFPTGKFCGPGICLLLSTNDDCSLLLASLTNRVRTNYYFFQIPQMMTNEPFDYNIFYAEFGSYTCPSRAGNQGVEKNLIKLLAGTRDRGRR